jgi:hypothetical protein
MNFVRAAFYLVLAVCAIRITMDLHQFMPHMEAALAGVQAIETNTTRTEAEMSGVLNTVRHIALDERASENAQIAAAQGLTSRGSKLLDDADVAVRHLDASAVELGTVAPVTNEAIRGIAADAHITLGAGTGTLDAATADLKDPGLKDAIVQLDTSAQNAATATSEAAGTMKSIHEGVDYEVAMIMKPGSKVKTTVLVIASALGNFLHGFL